MTNKNHDIAEKRKAIELYEQIMGDEFKSSRPLNDEELEDIFRKIDNMLDKNKRNSFQYSNGNGKIDSEKLKNILEKTRWDIIRIKLALGAILFFFSLFFWK